MKFKSAKEIYNNIINDNNDELYNKWQEAVKEKKKLNIITLIICIIVDIIIIYTNMKSININNIFFKSTNIFMIITIIVTDLIVYGIISIFGKKKREFNKEFKKSIVNRIISNFYNNLEYFPEKRMPEKIYNEPKYENYDNYHSEDYLEATIDNKYGIMMAEVETEREETYTDSNGDTQTRTTTLFHGLFAKIEMEKSINSNLRIEPNSKLRQLNLFQKEKLKMDSRRI